MVSEAISRFPELEFQEADAESVPFDDHIFDWVVVNYCAHHLARPEKVFKEIHRIIKPGGRVVIVHPIQSRQASWGSFLRALVEELPPETNPSGPLYDVENPEDYILMLSSCGFVNARCETRVKPVRIDRIEQLLTAAWAVTGLDDMPENIQTRIRAGTVKNARQYEQADGSIEFPDEVLLAWANP
jgi:SAM-dependent methyltransferase